jgi:peptide/nickel transport system substrate-binding protein
MARIFRCEPGSRKVGATRLEQGTPFETSAGAEALLNRPNLPKAKELIKEARYRGEKIVLLSATDQPIVDDQALATLAALRGAGRNVELQAND